MTLQEQLEELLTHREKELLDWIDAQRAVAFAQEIERRHRDKVKARSQKILELREQIKEQVSK